MVATDKVTVVVANTAFGHDLNGNLTNDSAFVYQYDPANRLTNVVSKSSGSSVLVARYDGLGRRREVVRNGTNTERYVYLPGTWLVLAVTDGTNGVKEVYTHGPDLSGTLGGAGGIGGIMGVRQAGVSYFLHGDALGNIVLATASNKPVAAFQYGAFGQLVTQSGTFDSRFKFSSKEYDREVGLLYFGYRYLSPKQGRWVNRDPLAEDGGVNLYASCGNGPVNCVDSFGLQFAGEAWMTDPLPSPQQTEMQGKILAASAGVFVEPFDWAMTGKEIYDDPLSPWSYAGLLPGVPAGAGKAGKKICKVAGAGKHLSINQADRLIQKGKVPKSVTRADKGKVFGEQDNIHFSDGTAINRDGTFKHGGRNLSRDEQEFLRQAGFNTP